MRCIIEKFLHLLLTWIYLGRLAQFFNVITRVFFYLFAMQNHCRLSILDCVEPDALEGTFQNGKSRVFIALLDKLNFGTNEFIITEILNKTYLKQKLGT